MEDNDSDMDIYDNADAAGDYTDRSALADASHEDEIGQLESEISIAVGGERNRKIEHLADLRTDAPRLHATGKPEG